MSYFNICVREGEIEKVILMSSSLPKISVVIVTYNRPITDVLECLHAVRGTLYPNFEIILVDNGTKSPSEFGSPSIENVHLIDVTGQKNICASGARNLGIKNSAGEYFFFVDDDVTVDENSLVELVKIAESNPSIGIIGPVMYLYNCPSKIWFYNDYLLKNSKEEIVDVPMIVGGALFISKRVIQKIGYFDESYFFYHEDWDFCYRVQKAGFRTVCATKVNSWHKVPLDEYSKLFISRRAYYWHRNVFIFAGRHRKTINGVTNFLFKQLIYYGGRNFPCNYSLIAIRRKKVEALNAYLHGILEGLVCLAKLMFAD